MATNALVQEVDAGLRYFDGVHDGIERLAHLVASVLDKHTNDGGSCAACPGVPFPCPSAVLAEHNVALL